jgi:lipoate-protein ligase A
MLFKNENVFLISHSHTKPSFNLASEEYFLCQREENYILLWRNEPAIIIGRHQNAYAEIDMDFISENSIPVIRRLTGGGAVFHDLGNLNFTFIKNGQEGFADFGEFLEPVTEYLRSLGLNAGFSGRNDILLDGMKISGNAQVNYKGRVLIHGTLLFSVAMNTLSKALRPNPLKLEAKGIRSVKSRVTNISEHLIEPLTIGQFTQGLSHFLSGREGCIKAELTGQDEKAINSLIETKYGTWEWNIGSAPKYAMEGTVLLQSGIVTAYFNVKNGLFSSVKLLGDFFAQGEIEELERLLVGTAHEKRAVLEALKKADVSKYIANTGAQELAEVFFK